MRGTKLASLRLAFERVVSNLSRSTALPAPLSTPWIKNFPLCPWALSDLCAPHSTKSASSPRSTAVSLKRTTPDSVAGLDA